MINRLSNTLLYAAGLLVLACVVLFVVFYQPQKGSASVSDGNAYIATSTAANSVYGATITGSAKVVTGPGLLGSWVITGANTGIVNFYDATTSDVNQRIAGTATSSILLASFPASTAAGTYTLDVKYKYGLYVDVISGSIATSTITYR